MCEWNISILMFTINFPAISKQEEENVVTQNVSFDTGESTAMLFHGFILSHSFQGFYVENLSQCGQKERDLRQKKKGVHIPYLCVCVLSQV